MRSVSSLRSDYRKLKALVQSNGSSYSLVLQERSQASGDNGSPGQFFFVNGVGTALHPVKFKYDPLNWNNSMRFSTFNHKLKADYAPGTLDLVFAPLGNANINFDLKIVSKDSSFVFGVLQGYIVDSAGLKHELSDFKAVFESAYSKL